MESTQLVIPYPKALEALKKCRLCAHLSEREADALVRTTGSQHYKAGAVAKAKGASAAGVEIVVSGLFEVRRPGQAARPVGPGGYLGGETVFSSEPTYHEVVAVEESDVLAVDREQMIKLMCAEPVLSTKLLWTLGQDLLADLERAEERLAADLLPE